MSTVWVDLLTPGIPSFLIAPFTKWGRIQQKLNGAGCDVKVKLDRRGQTGLLGRKELKRDVVSSEVLHPKRVSLPISLLF